MSKLIKASLDKLVEKMMPEVEPRMIKVVQTEDAVVLLSWESEEGLLVEVVQCDRSEVGVVELPLPEGKVPKGIEAHILHKTVSAIADIYGGHSEPDADNLYPVRWDNGIIIFGLNDDGMECRRIVDDVTDVPDRLFEKVVLN